MDWVADTNSLNAAHGDKKAANAKLGLDQLRLALQNLKPNCWLMPLLAAIVCIMFRRWVAVPILIFWFVLVTVGGSYLGVVAFIFPREQRAASEHQSWATHAALGYFLFAASWSVLGFLFWRRGDDLNHMLIMVLIACTLAGNAALVGADKMLTVIGYAVHGFALIAVPLQEGGDIYDGLAILAFLYVCYLAYMSGRIYTTARDMLLLRYDKNELIEALAKSKTESDRARERAEAASLAKSEFLANMSHELRTPLNAILGFSEIIYSNAPGANPSRYADYARLVHQSGSHLLALVNDILDLAKIEAGRFEVRDAEIDITRVISETVRLMADRAAAAGLTLVTDIGDGVPVLCADERGIRQILINLVSNAVKFTPAGGEVVIFCRRAASGDIIFGVRDTGVGIEPDDQLHVFQRFGQGRHDVASSEKGTGLGLTIVKGLVEAHDGHVELVSRAGEGTCVTATFPAARAKPLLKQAS
jgi:two-component system cell cycle sensor histidine kinase PleC